jgi:dTMP kinase
VRGLFITFEGCDGCGKSTQIQIVTKRLQELGYQVVVTREPGGTPFGEMVRDSLLDHSGPDRCALAEMFLYAASRAELVNSVILPALEAGKLVLSERFADSTLVYQGFAGGIPPEVIEKVNYIATCGISPDLTLVFDIADERIVENRLARREKDKIESRSDSYHARVREGYRLLASRYPDRVRLLDGSFPPDQVSEIILSEIHELMSKVEGEGRSL